jgi:uncharacterized protein (TIGR02466 family)
MNIIQVFSTPIWNSKFAYFEDQKETFLEAVSDFRKQNPEGVQKSNIIGYQSPITLTNEPRLSQLFDFVIQMGVKANFDNQFVDCDVYITAAWVNFNDSRAAHNHEHVHSDTYSGVFYLQVPEGSGDISFTNPGLNRLWQGTMLSEMRNKFTAEHLKFKPKEGDIYLWPSYVPHSVLPNNHDEARISISFNVICIPKGQVLHSK